MEILLNKYLPIPSEKYFETESISEIRHEFIDGYTYETGGESRVHNTITGNIGSKLSSYLDDKLCSTFILGLMLRVKSSSNESCYYPDVVVTCEPKDSHPQYLEKPTTILEVLSESTERIDRNEKFLAYTSLDSLEEYVLVSQDRKVITVARRCNEWAPEIIELD